MIGCLVFLALSVFFGSATAEVNKNWFNSSEFLPQAHFHPDTLKKHRVLTSLTFQNNDAEEAMNFYVNLFDNAEIKRIHRWGADGPGKEGTIMQAEFELEGHGFLVSDSPPVHNWDFTPAVSIFIQCKCNEEIERITSRLSENGVVAMPLNNYGFSQKFAWIIDQFGVSWQLNLE